MLPVRPWKPEAIVRLLVSLLVCQFIAGDILAFVRLLTTAVPDSWQAGLLAGGSAISLLATLFLLRKPWGPGRNPREFFFMLGLFYLGMTLGAFAQHYAGDAGKEPSTVRTLMATLSFQGLTLIFVWFFTKHHQTTWSEGFGFTVNWKVAALAGITAGCVFLPVGLFLQTVSAEVMTRFHVTPETQPAIEALRDTAMWYDRMLVGIAAIVLAPIAEEVLFRGILYPGIKHAGFPRLAWWVTSLLFALIHWNGAAFVPLLLLAVLLIALYEWSGNLLAPIMAHATFNALNFTMFFLFHGVQK